MVSTQWVPRLLTRSQKHTRMPTSQENLTFPETDPDGSLGCFLTVMSTGFITFRQKQRQSYNEALRRRRERFDLQGKWWPHIVRMQMIMCLLTVFKEPHSQWGEFANLLKQLENAIKTKYRGKLRKCFLFHQDNECSDRQIFYFNGCCASLWLGTYLFPFLFSWFGPIWLSSVP